MPGMSPLADLLAKPMATYLGPHTARVAVKTFSHKALGRGPETLTPGDVPALAEALRPMVRTLVGRETCEVILERTRRGAGAR
ncbi:MAG TPA: hypothetical protein VFS43_24930 [Polyangiaceae bacterium]|nr:hypothetical protein [Polyangiaceae bacterium]